MAVSLRIETHRRMTGQAKNVAILGSTGSIGRSTLEVIAASEGRLQAVALGAPQQCRCCASRPGL